MLREAPKTIQLLRLLNEFQYLTVRQLEVLGMGKRNTVYKFISRLQKERKPLLRLQKYQIAQSYERPKNVDGFVMMTPYGADALQDFDGLEDNELSYKKTASPPQDKYFHRRNQVDFQIATALFCEQKKVELVFYHTDYDVSGSNRNSTPENRLRSRTRVMLGDIPFIPDGLFMVRATPKQEYLFALEVYNGYSTKRVLSQLNKHVACIENGIIGREYGVLNKRKEQHPDRPQYLGCRVAVVFDSQEAMLSVLKRVTQKIGLMSLEKYFIFNTIDRIKENYASNWYNVHGQPNSSLFVKK